MSKTRSIAKRELQRSIDNIEWSLTHIKAFLDLGYKDLKDYKDPLDPVIKSLIMVQEVVKTLQSKV